MPQDQAFRGSGFRLQRRLSAAFASGAPTILCALLHLLHFLKKNIFFLLKTKYNCRNSDNLIDKEDKILKVLLDDFMFTVENVTYDRTYSS